MFGVDTSEFIVVAIVALLFIGPKELPRVMLSVGRWVGRARGYARHFTAGIENVMREAELEEMDRKWREQNERILAQYPADGHYPEPEAVPADPASVMLPSVMPTPPAEAFEDEPTLPLEAPAARTTIRARRLNGRCHDRRHRRHQGPADRSFDRAS
ncbi:twin-arginine translocase TatA/TatE family subunit [Sphingomonas rhizophila]|uniref:Twin-arginine translocase TatA/TatE family subunit n=1 Tax=Sphingomonas rhizophila TaxID=2071607 RepID=A0A7G9S9A6_9SPHN|nr:twin-arginine translocase TatA/TatE family subunit [Sphingomonas rhizophila]QNN64431.1 twin-arginine translocase TatA/TatE family subunit [Sphingomonas rhizophila]